MGRTGEKSNSPPCVPKPCSSRGPPAAPVPWTRLEQVWVTCSRPGQKADLSQLAKFALLISYLLLKRFSNTPQAPDLLLFQISLPLRPLPSSFPFPFLSLLPLLPAPFPFFLSAADPLTRQYLLVTKSGRSVIHTQTHAQPRCSFSVCDLEAVMSRGAAANVRAPPDEGLWCWGELWGQAQKGEINGKITVSRLLR